MKVLIAHTRHTAQFRAPILSSTNFEEEILPRLLHPDTGSARHISGAWGRSMARSTCGVALFGPTTIFFQQKRIGTDILLLRATRATKMLCNTNAVDGVIY